MEGVGFTSRLESEEPKRIKVTVTSSTEAYLTIKNPNEAEVITLTDRVTNVSVKAVVTRRNEEASSRK